MGLPNSGVPGSASWVGPPNEFTLLKYYKRRILSYSWANTWAIENATHVLPAVLFRGKGAHQRVAGNVVEDNFIEERRAEYRSSLEVLSESGLGLSGVRSGRALVHQQSVMTIMPRSAHKKAHNTVACVCVCVCVCDIGIQRSWREQYRW